jgi:hypothetical protein
MWGARSRPPHGPFKSPFTCQFFDTVNILALSIFQHCRDIDGMFHVKLYRQ